MFSLLLVLCSFACSAKDATPVDVLANSLARREAILSDILDAEKDVMRQSIARPPSKTPPEGYGTDPSGVFTNIGPHHSSNVYVPKGKKDLGSIYRFIQWTDPLELLWENSKKKFGDEITWQYVYHLNSNGTRGYPWTDFSHLFGPSMNWPIRKLFPDIESAHKLGDRFCTQPYEDNGGVGLNMTCCGVADPTRRYDDLQVYCADFALKDLFADFRKNSAKSDDCPKKIHLFSKAKSSIWHGPLRIEFSPLHNEMHTFPVTDIAKELDRGQVKRYFEKLELYLLEETQCET